METFVNKVAESGIITLNLEDYYPIDEITVFDMKDYLFMGLILKEKDFREALKNLDTAPFQNKIVALTCSSDAVIPVWAYMLVASLLQPIAQKVIFGSEEEIIKKTLLENIAKIVPSVFEDKRVVIKGCGDKLIPESAYVAITFLLRPFVKSIMYGEPCSTVPVFKKSKSAAD